MHLLVVSVALDRRRLKRLPQVARSLLVQALALPRRPELMPVQIRLEQPLLALVDHLLLQHSAGRRAPRLVVEEMRHRQLQALSVEDSAPLVASLPRLRLEELVVSVLSLQVKEGQPQILLVGALVRLLRGFLPLRRLEEAVALAAVRRHRSMRRQCLVALGVGCLWVVG